MRTNSSAFAREAENSASAAAIAARRMTACLMTKASQPIVFSMLEDEAPRHKPRRPHMLEVVLNGVMCFSSMTRSWGGCGERVARWGGYRRNVHRLDRSRAG